MQGLSPRSPATPRRAALVEGLFSGLGSPIAAPFDPTGSGGDAEAKIALLATAPAAVEDALAFLLLEEQPDPVVQVCMCRYRLLSHSGCHLY